MSFETMTRLVTPLVRNAPYALQVDELREAAIAFFGRTEAWSEGLDPVVLDTGSIDIEIDLPVDSALVGVAKCVVNGRELMRDEYSLTWGSPNALRLRGFGEPVTVLATAILKPSYSSKSLPQDIEGEYARPVSFGAISRLKSMSGTEWFDPQGASIFHEQFKNEMAKARRRSIQKRSGSSLRVTPVSFI